MTTIELEALVGHLFVVGGRAISSASPGAIATPPPRRPARGRDTDTLFGLLSLSAGEHQPAAFYEELTDLFSGTFFKVGGSVTAALREALIALNDSLREVNARRPEKLSVGLACAVLRDQEVYVAIAGPSRCLLVREGFTERLPDDEELAEGQLGLGLSRDPDVRFYRREIRTGDFLILADTSFNRLTDETLKHAVSSGQVDDTLNNLASVASQFSAAEVIKFVSPLAEGESDTIPDRRRPVVPPLPFFGGADDDQSGTPQTEEEALSVLEEEEGPGTPPGEAKQAAGQTEDSTELTGESAAPVEAGALVQKASHRFVLGLAGATDKLRELIAKMLPEEKEGQDIPQRLNLSPTIQIAVAVSIAVIVALVTTAVYKFRGQTSEYAELVRQAQTEIEQARAGGDNQAEARPHWENAEYLLKQAADVRPGGQEIATLRDQVITALDSYDHVTRVSPILLRSYEPGSYLKGPIVQTANIYLIDTIQDILYREDLNDEGTQLVNQEPQIITRQGELVANQVIGGLIDLAWVVDGGVPQRNVLAVLTRNGLLVTYSPTWDVTATILPGYEAWRDPRAIAFYDRDLYILDAGANEIWRYVAGPSSYPDPPQRYFTDVVPDLSNAVDMEIDTNGNVYVLHSSGQITKYFFGRPEAFDFTGLPQPLSDHPTALFLNLTVFDRGMFIADPGGERIYSTALNGAFLANYKDQAGTIFNSVSGIFSPDRPAFVYITAGNELYYFSRP